MPRKLTGFTILSFLYSTLPARSEALQRTQRHCESSSQAQDAEEGLVVYFPEALVAISRAAGEDGKLRLILHTPKDFSLDAVY